MKLRTSSVLSSYFLYNCRSCRARLEAHNMRQRERWTTAGGSRRRSRDAVDSLEASAEQQPAAPLQPAPQQPPLHPHTYAAAPADQARAAFAALLSMPAIVPPIVTPGQVRIECCPHLLNAVLHPASVQAFHPPAAHV